MSKKIVLGGVSAAVIVIVLALWWFLGREPQKAPVQLQAVPSPVMSPTPSPSEELHGRLKGVTLATADPVLRELAANLSSRPELMKWMASDDLIRRCVATVDNIAKGRDPRVHLGFLKPVGAFRVKETAAGTFIDPRSYQRYDTIAEVFSSLDVEGLAQLYSEIKPLVEEADREISRPQENFEDHLRMAIDQLLAVPVVKGQVEVKPKVVTWTYADPHLEGLSPVQRHFLRMGPENVEKIQEKLREIRTALGL